MRAGPKGVSVPIDVPTFDAALGYLDSGLPITLCDGKRPLGQGWSRTGDGRDWQRKKWTPREIRRAFEVRGPLNVGVLLGSVSRIIDLEADGPEGEWAFSELFQNCDPPIGPTFQSERGKHRLFACDERLQSVGKAVTHFCELEIRIGAKGKGAQSLLPPSINENGTRRQWLVPLDECLPPPLPEVVIERIVSAARRPKVNSNKLLHGSDMSGACAGFAESVASAVLPDMVKRAIALTIPAGPGERNRRIFDFVLHLKAVPELAALEARALKQFVVAWHKAALPFIRTKEFEETWLDFGTAWKKAKFAAGQEPIVKLFHQAICHGLPSEAHRYQQVGLQQLVALCRELQRFHGQAPFFLDCRTAGKLLVTTYVQASKWLRVLVLDDVIEIETVGKRGRATEYRYMGAID